MVRAGKSKAGRAAAYGRLLVSMVLCGLLCQQIALAKKQPPAKPIDINAANAKELEQLPGVGPTTANAIILFRTRTGRFRRIDDLLAVRGISEPKLKKMRRYITLGPPPKKSP